MIDISSILLNAFILFILGLLSTLILGFNLPGIIVKAVYFVIIIGFYLYMIYFDESELVKGVQKWVEFFINVLIPMIIGEAFGDALTSLIKGRKTYE